MKQSTEEPRWTMVERPFIRSNAHDPEKQEEKARRRRQIWISTYGSMKSCVDDREESEW